MHIVIGILGIIFFLALAVLFSSDRKNIRWRYVGLLLVIQLIFAFILLKTNLGISVIGSISDGFNYLLAKQRSVSILYLVALNLLILNNHHSSLAFCYLLFLFQH